MKTRTLQQQNVRWAKRLWQNVAPVSLSALKEASQEYRLSVIMGDLLYLNGCWYVTHAGLTRLARRKACVGIHVSPVSKLCDVAASRWAFKATVFKSSDCRGFVSYGDADPSNVSPLVRGAEMRVAETRAVNRALRKAYGIGICSVEEIGSLERPSGPQGPVRKLPPESSSRNNRNGVNVDGSRIRDRLCQIIREHNLDATLVKAYAIDFCGTKTLREASRDQVENFVARLADWASKDRISLLCQLNSYAQKKEGAA